CSNCKEIDQGNSLDVREIDGASNRGIDEIRDLRDDIKFSPAKTRKKIYIIDEVHMLTNQAFNALLKTLEEPPDHAVFIFATTEVNEVPATILSRCQRHDFKRVEISVLSDALKNICKKEGVSIDEESLILISKAGDGSVRDAESCLDQVIAYSGNNITVKTTYQALGLPALDSYFEFIGIITSGQTAELMDFVEKMYSNGLHILSFIKGLTEFFRDLLLFKTSGEAKITDMTTDNIKRLTKYKDEFGEKDILFFIDILSRAVPKLKMSPFQRIDLELTLLKILHYEPVTDIKTLIDRLSKIEGDFEVGLEDVASGILRLLNDNGIKAAVSAEEKENGPPPDKKKTPAINPKKNLEQDPEALCLEKIRAGWKKFTELAAKEIKLSAIEYGDPYSLKNSLLKIRFDPRDIVFRKFCIAKKNSLETLLNSFFDQKSIKVELKLQKVPEKDRLIKIKKNTRGKSFEEKKNDLLKRSPQLKFLFEEPFNCRFIDK
ncbi:MAG: DNA polymerase III subunit gamma/tau, partial [Candidatus Delongbacteria bacterium]